MNKIRVCARAIPDSLGRGLHRVANALERYAPSDVTLVREPSEADLLIIHCIGHGSMELLHNYDRDYAMIQYCLLTTEDARPEAWAPYWQKARAIWSYYDLKAYCHERHERHVLPDVDSAFKFYHAPLGVDGTVFKPSMPIRKQFIIGTSGYVAETEGVKECHTAAQIVKRPMFHLGPNLALNGNVVSAHNLTDTEVATFWSLCTYVAGMRRIEGFELPAIEGLACGARPVCFDAPHYRQWFGEHAEYVPEADHGTVIQHLVELFKRPARPVTESERKHVLEKFNWQTVAQGFWEALR